MKKASVAVVRSTVKAQKFKQMSTSKWLLPCCLSKENFFVRFPTFGFPSTMNQGECYYPHFTGKYAEP